MTRAIVFLLAVLVTAGGCGPKPIYRTEPIEAPAPQKPPEIAEPQPAAALKPEPEPAANPQRDDVIRRKR